ncbi:MAG: hypothetical protein L6Q99_07200 [Planctomycetes bacterium]|nr:hypothetical protein [Planctomycetota bacterium]
MEDRQELLGAAADQTGLAVGGAAVRNGGRSVGDGSRRYGVPEMQALLGEFERGGDSFGEFCARRKRPIVVPTVRAPIAWTGKRPLLVHQRLATLQTDRLDLRLKCEAVRLEAHRSHDAVHEACSPATTDLTSRTDQPPRLAICDAGS